jgi:hypothetical protein
MKSQASHLYLCIVEGKDDLPIEAFYPEKSPGDVAGIGKNWDLMRLS